MSLASTLALPLLGALCLAAPPALDEREGGDGEWGFRPVENAPSETNPPSFSWRPQRGIVVWEIECSRGEKPGKAEYRAQGIAWNVHCPPRALPPGEYSWRYRGTTAEGEKTAWSRPRRFTLPVEAAEMPMPPREELLGRIPTSHPRLFVRPEQLAELRRLAAGPLKDRFDRLVARCERLLKEPPPTAEPPTYPPGTVRLSEEWREIWWGNRVYTINALDNAATLAFTRLLGGKEEYGRLARRILLDCAEWDPLGATGYRYNDEAGMPYAYHFARTYSFVHDLLSEKDRETCRRVMKVRGEEMYRHLCPTHFWQPYGSHRNRAWHFLGELGIAFHGEIEGADDWTWFAANVFFNAYPVWSDDDGGWHEGSSYWNSYIARFTWWADVMRAALDMDVYRKPYFARVGYYPMYLMPPGKVGGGFGDLCAPRKSSDFVPLMTQLAAQAGNGHWQWWVERHDAPTEDSTYLGFLRAARPRVEPAPPDDLPSSRLFRGTGQACLNTSIRDAGDSVQVVFKSSPFGTQSHGYEANNSFLLWAYGQRLLVRSGYRDIYGSDHHRRWMWSTRSVNNITVNGQGQLPHSAAARGRIVDFRTTPLIDAVVGEAGEAYRTKAEIDPDDLLLDRFTRTVLFVKPDLVVVYDRLAARQPSSFEYWLHAVEKFDDADARDMRLRVGEVGCRIGLLAPEGLTLSQTNEYDPNPRPRITLREWHLTAATPGKQKNVEFVAAYRPYRIGEPLPELPEMNRNDGGYVLQAEVEGGTALVLLPVGDEATVAAEGLSTTGKPLVALRRQDGSLVEQVAVEVK
jgi:hypothetical protein